MINIGLSLLYDFWVLKGPTVPRRSITCLTIRRLPVDYARLRIGAKNMGIFHIIKD